MVPDADFAQDRRYFAASIMYDFYPPFLKEYAPA